MSDTLLTSLILLTAGSLLILFAGIVRVKTPGLRGFLFGAGLIVCFLSLFVVIMGGK